MKLYKYQFWEIIFNKSLWNTFLSLKVIIFNKSLWKAFSSLKNILNYLFSFSFNNESYIPITLNCCFDLIYNVLFRFKLVYSIGFLNKKKIFTYYIDDDIKQKGKYIFKFLLVKFSSILFIFYSPHFSSSYYLFLFNI